MLEKKTIEQLEELSPYELSEILYYVIFNRCLDKEYLDELISYGVDINNGVVNLLPFSNSPIYEGIITTIFPLHLAVDLNYITAIKLLLAAGADLETRDEWCRTAIHYAIWDIDVIKIMIKAGADLESKSNVGWSVLHRAAHYKRADAIKILLAAGASKNISANDGRTPWDVAHPIIMENVPELDPNVFIFGDIEYL